MIDHMSLQVADMAAATGFYDTVLAPLGWRRVMDFGDHAVAYGGDHPAFWVGPAVTEGPAREVHVGFAASDRAAVDAFHAAAAAAGAEVLHTPRLWPEYHPHYYAAFVRDPDGNNVEAVCHTPE
ncbi:VOC family protein [Streptomonospora litoralis]|uniref:Glyoxalase-like domain protein n=1 Tax=Streptomonospora litoralis TaxID=2498135 RepID=A0A4P6Q9P4_9ACTN|nr:VOC family protein [Streptomonospora litoralis]QBI56014.1 Glyoxalase-like domain protein [Streptomonospora litoralis]